MEQQYIVQTPPETSTALAPESGRWEDYLTPEQRLDAIAEIFVTIALRIVREQNGNTSTTNL